jgi:ketosteroid isomerase-like protein
MSQENVKIVREAFEAFLGGDREKTAQLVDSGVEFHGTVGGLQEGQIGHGQSQIDQTFEAEDLEAWEERRRGRGSGVELETKTAVVIAVTGRRVVRIQGYMDRDAALKAAGLSE